MLIYEKGRNYLERLTAHTIVELYYFFQKLSVKALASMHGGVQH